MEDARLLDHFNLGSLQVGVQLDLVGFRPDMTNPRFDARGADRAFELEFVRESKGWPQDETPKVAAVAGGALKHAD